MKKLLIERGVVLPDPDSVFIAPEVDPARIHAGAVIHPGCRIGGAETAIGPGAQIGAESPVTLRNCQVGKDAVVSGGFLDGTTVLDGATVGDGFHSRPGTLLEECSSVAHTVGLKQTVLMPYVTLGSLINFCDCLMAGGTSRSNHSEVGSSYIHFNFTPDADKTTPSLLGDVPRGVMLNQPPIFLGGQGGIIGPVRMGFGNVAAAGSVLRHDYPDDGLLIFETTPADGAKNYRRAAYPNLRRIVENNILYLANLSALESWYAHVRRPFLDARPFGPLIYAGVLETLASAKKERLKRLKAMAQKAAANPGPEEEARKEFLEQTGFCEDLFTGKIPDGFTKTDPLLEAFLQDFEKSAGNDRTDYVGAVRKLPGAVSAKGTAWLNGIVGALCNQAARAMPSMGLFRN